MASAELDAAIAYYEQQRTGLGSALQAVVERATRRIQQNPSIGGLYKTTELRHLVLRRFPYNLFYMETEDAIWIVAIAHGRRRPDYWRRRKVG
jgi:toxin ParE1/3/4